MKYLGENSEQWTVSDNTGNKDTFLVQLVQLNMCMKNNFPLDMYTLGTGMSVTILLWPCFQGHQTIPAQLYNV